MADRNPKDLSPEMYEKYILWDEEMKVEEIDYILTCTKRTQEEQLELWKLGREWKNGKWINTNKKAQKTWTLNSNHKDGNAFDFVIMVAGKPDWNMIYKDKWNKAVEIGKRLGLTQVVDSKGRVLEFAHLQLA